MPSLLRLGLHYEELSAWYNEHSSGSLRIYDTQVRFNSSNITNIGSRRLDGDLLAPNESLDEALAVSIT